jgi:DHA3 family macrolide efflux protein-like MFS transporter
MNTFFVIWIGQLVSLLGTGMTRFALILWAWQQTGEATTLALLGFFSYIPQVLIGPIAGIVVDRHDRRLVMMIADGCAGLMTIGLLLLFVTGHLRIWHLYVVQTLTSVFESLQHPAYSAATTMLVPKEQYARTSGMRSLAASTSTVLAPILAGILLALIDIDGIMLIDVVTFVCAMGTLVLVRIPHPKAVTETEDAHTSSRLRRLSFGFRYISTRQGLLGLLLIFSGMNLFAALTYLSILPAMILARTNSNSIALATVQGALGIGGIVGGLIISIWGGPKRRIHACLLGAALSFLIGDLLLAVGRSLPVWAAAAFLASVFIPFVDSAHQAIWQSKVAPDVQGRVFSAKSMLQLATFPIGYLFAGTLADSLFEPAMAVGGPLSEGFGWLVGVGPGAGIALMFVGTSVLGTTMSLSGYLFRSVRDVETEIPDHVVEVAV